MAQQNKAQEFTNIFLSDNRDAVIILDQSLIPTETVYKTLREKEEMFDAIYQLRVRGAPAIGIFAAFCMYVLARSMDEQDRDAFQKQFDNAAAYLESSRPTAVNLHWALERMRRTAKENGKLSFRDLLEKLRVEAETIQQEDAAMCRAISENGLSFLKNGDGVLTYCNAGPMACSQYGTAQGALILAKERGLDLRVFACETRPLLQGARLTSYELHQAGLDVTLICDNMASIVMKNGWINACYVGCDRIAANGDTANKIGTSGVAVLAKHYGIPFYVLGPTSTIDLQCPSGADIHIEERPQAEIREKYYARPMALPEVKCYNPSFDVTDHELITAIITEKGICLPPFSESLPKLMKT